MNRTFVRHRMNVRFFSPGTSTLTVIAVVVTLIVACRPESETDPPAGTHHPPEAYAGGSTTIFNAGSLAYQFPATNLNGAAFALFEQGESIFHEPFTPLGEGSFDGLGPLFIHFSCVECHAGNGRGHPPYVEDDNTSGLLLRLSIAGQGEFGEPLGVPGFGVQYQTLALAGDVPEGKFTVTWENVPVTLGDGTTVNLRQPYYNLYNTYLPLPPDMLKSGRNAPPVIGLGLLEAIPEEDILAWVDEGDEDGDGISGKANFVWDQSAQSIRLGRFGWKSSNASVRQQTADALLQDMGITTEDLLEQENCAGQTNCTSGIQEGGDLSAEALDFLVFYTRTLAVPASRNHDDPEVIRGKELFSELYCDRCHVPSWTTGTSDIPALSNQVIYPYTDLLLHDLGEGLGDGRPDYQASANEWRTPPLWGIGLSLLASPQGTFLHDGRASTLEEAILWHGGEAYWSREDYIQLTQEDRAALLRFLESL